MQTGQKPNVGVADGVINRLASFLGRHSLAPEDCLVLGVLFDLVEHLGCSMSYPPILRGERLATPNQMQRHEVQQRLLSFGVNYEDGMLAVECL